MHVRRRAAGTGGQVRTMMQQLARYQAPYVPQMMALTDANLAYVGHADGLHGASI